MSDGFRRVICPPKSTHHVIENHISKKEMKYVSVERIKEGVLPDGQKFEKIPISVQHPDNTVGPLVIATDLCGYEIYGLPDAPNTDNSATSKMT